MVEFPGAEAGLSRPLGYFGAGGANTVRRSNCGLVKIVTDYLSECIQVPQPEERSD